MVLPRAEHLPQGAAEVQVPRPPAERPSGAGGVEQSHGPSRLRRVDQIPVKLWSSGMPRGNSGIRGVYAGIRGSRGGNRCARGRVHGARGTRGAGGRLQRLGEHLWRTSALCGQSYTGVDRRENRGNRRWAAMATTTPCQTPRVT